MKRANKPPQDATYRKDYNAGWLYSHSDNANLDNSGNKSDAWLDGYLDFAVGREKWHLYYCPKHDNDPGGCGAA